MNKPLPRPVTTPDYYLAAILDELKAIHAQLDRPEPEPEPAAVEDAEVEIKEPAPVLTPLPDDFPGKAPLEEAGIIYLETVPVKGDELVKIPGIGGATANKILTWFKT